MLSGNGNHDLTYGDGELGCDAFQRIIFLNLIFHLDTVLNTQQCAGGFARWRRDGQNVQWDRRTDLSACMSKLPGAKNEGGKHQTDQCCSCNQQVAGLELKFSFIPERFQREGSRSKVPTVSHCWQ